MADDTTCTVEDCDRDAACRRLCDMHYKRTLRAALRYSVDCPTCGETKATRLPDRKYCSKSCASSAPGRNRGSRAGAITLALRAGNPTLVLAAIADRSTPGDGGCHIWSGGVNQSGYPIVSAGRSSRLVHRLALEMKMGRPLGRQQAHHVCGVVACVNPDHLAPADQAENIAEMHARVSLLGRISDLEAALRAVDPSNKVL